MMQIPTFPIFLSLGTRITHILFGLSQNTTIIRWLTNLKKRSNLDSIFSIWYEFPYFFSRWTTKEMQLLVRDMDDLTACLELMRWVSASRIWFYKRNSGADPGYQVRRAHLKKLRRAEGGANIFGVFRVKNHDFTPKNHIFSNCEGRRENCWGISCEKSRFYAKKYFFF